MKENVKDGHQKSYLIIVFLISFLPRVWVALKMLPLRTLSDELSTLASAAFLAGLDWKLVISKAGYYGFGFYWIFFPLFHYMDNPIVIYRIILVVCALMQASSSCIAFYVLGRFFKIRDAKVKMLISIISSYMVVTRATITYNEHVLILLTWIIVMVLCFILEDTASNNDNHKMKCTAVLLLLLLY